MSLEAGAGVEVLAVSEAGVGVEARDCAPFEGGLAQKKYQIDIDGWLAFEPGFARVLTKPLN